MHPNPRKTGTVRHLGKIDILRLREAVLALPEAVWDAENAAKPNRFDALDSTRHIIFRFVSKLGDWRRSFDGPLWAEWQHLVQPILAAATKDYAYGRGGFPRIMLARMAPGGVIHPHRDTNRAAQWPHKIHLPLVTSDKVTFVIDDMPYHFAEGEAVEVNNMATHAVANHSTVDRIHLIFEYFDLEQPDPDWMMPLEELH